MDFLEEIQMSLVFFYNSFLWAFTIVLLDGIAVFYNFENIFCFILWLFFRFLGLASRSWSHAFMTNFLCFNLRHFFTLRCFLNLLLRASIEMRVEAVIPIKLNIFGELVSSHLQRSWWTITLKGSGLKIGDFVNWRYRFHT